MTGIIAETLAVVVVVRAINFFLKFLKNFLLVLFENSFLFELFLFKLSHFCGFGKKYLR
jgi:hypothetical protein